MVGTRFPQLGTTRGCAAVASRNVRPRSDTNSHWQQPHKSPDAALPDARIQDLESRDRKIISIKHAVHPLLCKRDSQAAEQDSGIVV
jgi:hypothetical protein